MRTIFSQGQISIIDMGGEFYVYVGQKLVRVCPSIGMTREVAAGEA